MKFKASLFVFLFFVRSYTGLSSSIKTSVNSESSSNLHDASYAMIQSEVAQINNKQLLSQDVSGDDSSQVTINKNSSNIAVIIIMITLVVILIIFLVVRFKTRRQTDAVTTIRRSMAGPENDADNDVAPLNPNPEENPRNQNNQSNYGTFAQS